MTPTNVSLMNEPSSVRTAILKFDTPARSAKLVASICYGVTLAIITDIGRNMKHIVIISPITSVKRTKYISEMPQAKFQRHTNMNYIGAIMIAIKASMMISLRYSVSRKYLL